MMGNFVIIEEGRIGSVNALEQLGREQLAAYGWDKTGGRGPDEGIREPPRDAGLDVAESLLLGFHHLHHDVEDHARKYALDVIGACEKRIQVLRLLEQFLLHRRKG